MTKKNFKQSPSDFFIDKNIEGQISTEQYGYDPKTAIKEEAPFPEPVKKKEARSQRVQLLTTPSQHQAMKALADEAGESANELYNRAIAFYLEARRDKE